ncbi:uncharacterized protein BT62DRAFT_952962 [Guyanagaster necrorhizus]|uniref:Uncharacterized protein n=1 Tax=Guyanagaster necrorhizus TaxID=856835 RepID=A0A9P7VNK1_9AGAR|nr:uncharacterized protein BT62DRAFT_952962 [Guyanagaster necrorhizus MCA 3950]KAG7444024.1 hypothetical protein BT62DRAFT_952962 [Guyanagaster necrorhizus MCA 3950]
MNLLWILGLSFSAYGVALYLGRAVRRRLLVKQTCVLDIDSLGLRLPREKIKGTAVICGGSIGGLMAARVCHDHFDDVVVVEPEAWLNTADATRVDPWNQQSKRSRIMQYDSLHVLLPLGYKAMSKLFPNLEEQGKASGIKVGPSKLHIHFWGNDTRMPDEEYGGALPKTIYAGRAGMETFLRRLVLGGDYKNIRQVIGTVTGVARNTRSPEFIDQVTIRTPEGIQNIPAVLVVDCTGVAAAGMKWLRREGYGFADRYSPNQLPLDQLKIAYDQKLHYTTLQFHVTPELGRELPGLPVPYDECWVIYHNSMDPKKDNRSVYSHCVDGDIIQICFSAMGECELPKTLEEAKACARSLVTEKPIPETFFQMLDMLDKVKDTMTCSEVHYPGSSYIRYERAANLPTNWVAMGDSVMRINPIYGQGCSKAFFGAICLHKLLMDSTVIPKDLSKKYFRIHAEKISPLWASLKVGDYSFPTTVPLPGETLSKGSWLRWYMKKLTILSFTDDQAGSVLWHIRSLLAPTTDALQPALIFKVCLSLIKG